MITIKSEKEISVMGEGGRILSSIIKELEKLVKPGTTTLELDRAAEALILSYGARPAFKGYEGFPYSLCASVNENIVHGFPSDDVLKEGDVLKLDLGVSYKGFNTDMAVTVPVGRVSKKVGDLIRVTKEALGLGIKEAVVGNSIGDVGNAVQTHVESHGFGVIRDLCGHGIGKKIHEDPRVPNFGKKSSGEELEEGMVICIEPMVAIGDYNLKKSGDGYGYATKDGSLSAHFEHTIAITKSGPQILTQS